MHPSILALGTAVPPYKTNQSELVSFMTKYLGEDELTKRKIQALFRMSGIESRYSVLPDFTTTQDNFEFFPKSEDLEPFPSTGLRMAKYQESALQLSTEAIEKCLSKSTIDKADITHIITVSCTGMYAPGLDIELVETMGLSSTIERTAINFMGCYAAFNALKVADNIVKVNPESKVLIVAVELCSIHFQKSTSDDLLTSNALFGDGAAAVLVGEKVASSPSISLNQFHSDLALQGKKEMGWFIKDLGFEMKLTGEVPFIIKDGIQDLTNKLLNKLKLNLSNIHYFAIHPGGRRILEVIENALGIGPGQNQYSHNVMKSFGNMSSPTVLFVLHDIWHSLSKSDDGKNILSFAFGPGLTLESMLLKVHY